MAALTEVDRVWHTVLSTDVTAARTHCCLWEWSHGPGSSESLHVWWCVCMCSQHCCGDNESERQTAKQRPLVVGPPPSPSCAALKSLCVSFMSVCVWSVSVYKMHCAWLFKCMRSQRSSSGPILRPATHGVPRPPQTHWANDQPWQLKPICESVWHQEGHLLPAL